MNVKVLLAFLAIALVVLSFFVSGPLVAIAVLILAVAIIVDGRV